MKKLAIPTIENLRLLGEVLYNLTGLQYYLNLPLQYYTSVAMCGVERGDYFRFYYDNYRLMNKLINEGNTFEFPLYNVSTKNIKPFIYNSL